MWIILFTGRYPQSFFEFQVKLIRWQVRWMSRLYNLVDDYPAFGLDGTDEYTSVEIEYPEHISRSVTLVKMFFGFFYVLLPHVFVLTFMRMWGAILRVIAWWVVLFTGTYPESFHEFNVGLIRWNVRVVLYMGYMSDEYPPFSGKELDDTPATPKQPNSDDAAAATATAATGLPVSEEEETQSEETKSADTASDENKESDHSSFMPKDEAPTTDSDSSDANSSDDTDKDDSSDVNSDEDKDSGKDKEE